MRDISQLSDDELNSLIGDSGGGNEVAPANVTQAPQSRMQLLREAGPAFVKGVGHGIYEAAQGPYQIGAEVASKLGLDDFNQDETYTKVVDAQRKAYNASLDPNTKLASQAGNFAGNVLPYLATPGSALVGGAIQGATSYVPEGDSRAVNTALGATVGKVAEKAMQGGGKLYNAIRGGTEDPAAKALIEAGEQFNVPVFAGDASQNPALKSLTNKFEDVPVLGVQGERYAQMQAAQSAAEKEVEALRQKMLSTNVDIKGLQKLAESDDPIRGAAAKSILDDLANAGDDWNAIMQNSGKLGSFKNKLIADDKYSSVAKIADQRGAVGKANTLTAIDDAIKRASDSVLPDEGLIKTLQTLRTNIGARDFNYSQTRETRTAVSNLIKDYYKGQNSLIGGSGVGYLQGVKKGLDKDMNMFAQQNGPELKAAWQDADSFYQKNVIPYKDAQLAKALTSDSPDEIYKKFITRGEVEGDKGTGRALKFYNALDEKGRSAVRYGMVKDALETAVERDTGMFSPAKFATQLEKSTAARGVFFKGAQKEEIEGLKTLMRGVQRSKIAVSKPETGVKVIPWLVGLGGAGGALAAGASVPALGAVAAGVYGVKKLLTTTAGRRLLLASSKIEPSSPAMQKILQSANKLVQTSAVKEGVELQHVEKSEPQAAPMQSAAPQQDIQSLSDEELDRLAGEEPQTPAPVNQGPVTQELLNKISYIESGNNPNARAATSSASGQFQFTNGTWRDVVKRYGAETGITLKDKNNPRAQAIMTAKMLGDNAAELKPVLGRDPTNTDLYLSHFLGLGGAKKLFSSHPMQYAARIFPEAAKANRSLFYKNGQPLTVAQLYDAINAKVTKA